MPSQGLVEGYIGPNPSHQAFKRELVSVKAFVFLYHQHRKDWETTFANQLEEAQQASPGIGAFGVVTEVLSQKQFRICHIPVNEAIFAMRDFGVFEQQLYSQIYRDSHRLFVTYLLELFGEVARNEPRVLISQKTVA